VHVLHELLKNENTIGTPTWSLTDYRRKKMSCREDMMLNVSQVVEWLCFYIGQRQSNLESN
jgi:hypothetical protein